MSAPRAAGAGAALVLCASLVSLTLPPFSRSAFKIWITFSTLSFGVAIIALLLYPFVRGLVMQLSKGSRSTIGR
jgi:hypothetical protein